MNRGKAVCAAALVALLLAGLLWTLYRLQSRAFTGAALLLAVYGFWRGCGSFCRWLSDRETLLPARPGSWAAGTEEPSLGPIPRARRREDEP